MHQTETLTITKRETFKPLLTRQIETVPVANLKPYPNNPRTHSKKPIRPIAESLKQFGWTNPVLADGDGMTIAGHRRLEAAKLVGMEHVPVIRIEAMSDTEKRAHILADNKLAENAGWDIELLAIELQCLTESNFDFDIEITGFETGEVDVLLAGSDSAEPEPVEMPDLGRTVVSRIGDNWQIGQNRILCGNTLDAGDWQTLIGQDKVPMVFTDPPYNVKSPAMLQARGRRNIASLQWHLGK